MSMMYDVIIVGAGSMGAAAGYYLAAQGRKTLLLDSFRPPHDRGSHHGDTRIIRHAYGEDRRYVPFALRAQRLWGELEDRSGVKLFYNTGHLNAGAEQSKFLREVAESVREFSLPVETLSPEEINSRWPGMKVPESFIGLFETSSGALKSELCIDAFLRLAVETGAELMTDSRVEDVSVQKDGVTVRTGSATYHGQAAILCAGAWAGRMLSSVGIELPLHPIRKTIAWFDADESLYGSDVFPTFLYDLPDTSMYYGFPSIGGAGLKVGRHDGGQNVSPDETNPAFGTYPEDAEDLTSFLSQYMPGSERKLKHGAACMYTMTPDENFIIDVHPEHSHIAFAAGFSGHGFKFSSAVGEALTQLVTAGRAEQDLSLFSALRFQGARK
jgi:N-methyl-L-tryptophan oxidase